MHIAGWRYIETRDVALAPDSAFFTTLFHARVEVLNDYATMNTDTQHLHVKTTQIDCDKIILLL